ncbi:hypothetical protein IMY05_C4874000100 [Salix suchowensis]|nr:hypothetical protein IMY05_C4874000100 [Salix suchowensis]
MLSSRNKKMMTVKKILCSPARQATPNPPSSRRKSKYLKSALMVLLGSCIPFRVFLLPPISAVPRHPDTPPHIRLPDIMESTPTRTPYRLLRRTLFTKMLNPPPTNTSLTQRILTVHPLNNSLHRTYLTSDECAVYAYNYFYPYPEDTRHTLLLHLTPLQVIYSLTMRLILDPMCLTMYSITTKSLLTPNACGPTRDLAASAKTKPKIQATMDLSQRLLFPLHPHWHLVLEEMYYCLRMGMSTPEEMSTMRLLLPQNFSGDNTADPVAVEQNADTPNDVAGPGPDSDDLEDARIHGFDNHGYGSESNDLYVFDRGCGFEALFSSIWASVVLFLGLLLLSSIYTQPPVIHKHDEDAHIRRCDNSIPMRNEDWKRRCTT